MESDKGLHNWSRVTSPTSKTLSDTNDKPESFCTRPIQDGLPNSDVDKQSPVK